MIGNVSVESVRHRRPLAELCRLVSDSSRWDHHRYMIQVDHFDCTIHPGLSIGIRCGCLQSSRIQEETIFLTFFYLAYHQNPCSGCSIFFTQ
ncbi:hypothetical protein P879_00795 [Paragonimus westermani]|uniref:Uncharacterized protein n=1 Tax=Paragonimus westermani TaxID=34504 RepID=A0A8T0DWC2_9TREM|nr:hypothetical protein P879_00795 [Paragonimus westermani]